MNLKNVLSVRGQTQKNIYCIVLFMWNSRTEDTTLWGLKSEQWFPVGVNGIVRKGAQGNFLELW